MNSTAVGNPSKFYLELIAILRRLCHTYLVFDDCLEIDGLICVEADHANQERYNIKEVIKHGQQTTSHNYDVESAEAKWAAAVLLQVERNERFGNVMNKHATSYDNTYDASTVQSLTFAHASDILNEPSEKMQLDCMQECYSSSIEQNTFASSECPTMKENYLKLFLGKHLEGCEMLSNKHNLSQQIMSTVGPVNSNDCYVSHHISISSSPNNLRPTHKVVVRQDGTSHIVLTGPLKKQVYRIDLDKEMGDQFVSELNQQLVDRPIDFQRNGCSVKSDPFDIKTENQAADVFLQNCATPKLSSSVAYVADVSHEGENAFRQTFTATAGGKAVVLVTGAFHDNYVSNIKSQNDDAIQRELMVINEDSDHVTARADCESEYTYGSSSTNGNAIMNVECSPAKEFESADHEILPLDMSVIKQAGIGKEFDERLSRYVECILCEAI